MLFANIGVPRNRLKIFPPIHISSQDCTIYSIERLPLRDQTFQTVAGLAEKDCSRCPVSEPMVFKRVAAF